MSDLIARLQFMLVALLSGTSAKGMLASTTSRSRAVTFIEYAILAAIAVGIGILFKSQLGELFTDLFDKLGDGLDDSIEAPAAG